MTMKFVKAAIGAAVALVGMTSVTGAYAQSKPAIRYGIYEPGLDSGFLLMAEKKKLWDEQGVKVEVVTFKSAAQAFPAFLAGEVDVVQANPSEAMLASSKGADIKFIGSTMPGLNYALYAGSKYNAIEDLVGGTIGISAPTALPAVVAKAMLISKGIDPKKVTYMNSGGSPDRYLAVVNKVIDAASSPSDYVSRTKTDNVKVLAMAKNVIPDYPRYALISTNAFLQKNPDAVVGFIAGLVKGMRYAGDHPDEANQLSAENAGGLKADDPSILAAYSEFKDGGYLALNGEVPVKQMKYLAELQTKLGISPKPVNVDPLVDDSFRQKAIQKIGEVKSTYYGSK